MYRTKININIRFRPKHKIVLSVVLYSNVASTDLRDRLVAPEVSIQCLCAHGETFERVAPLCNLRIGLGCFLGMGNQLCFVIYILKAWAKLFPCCMQAFCFIYWHLHLGFSASLSMRLCVPLLSISTEEYLPLLNTNIFHTKCTLHWGIHFASIWIILNSADHNVFQFRLDPCLCPLLTGITISGIRYASTYEDSRFPLFTREYRGSRKGLIGNAANGIHSISSNGNRSKATFWPIWEILKLENALIGK